MKLFFTLCFCITLSTVNGQTFDDIISSNKYVDCQDVSFNTVAIIGQLYTTNKLDDVYEFLDYWEAKCGFKEPIFRLRTILNIKTNTFEADSISSSLIEHLITYRVRNDFDWFTYFNYPNKFRDNILKEIEYDSLTQNIATNTLSNDLDESLILDFYSSETPSFEKIKKAPSHSRLNQAYNEVYTETFRKPQFHFAFLAGGIKNYGGISIFGTRPSLGFLLGGKQLRHNFDLILDIRIGPSKESYSFLYEGSLITDDSWTGMYLGGEYTYDIIQSNKIDIGISPGIGLDRITALNTDNDYGEDSKFLSGFNSNIGLVFKYKYGTKGKYVGMHFRYNWISYNNPGGTQLNGEYLGIRLTFGSIYESFRYSRLKNLE